MTIDKSWTSIKNRLSKKYLDGVKIFISRAKAYVNEEGKVRCPCRKCLNHYWQNLRVVHNHLIDKGFQQSYRTWYYHGESLEPHRDKGKRVASSNEKSKRGSSRSITLKKAIEDNKGNPLPVQFDIADDNDPDQRKSATYKPIGRNGKLFNNHLAQVVRQVIDHSVLSWKKVSPVEKEIVMNQMHEKFVFESSDLINDAIDQTMSNNWRDSRYRWHVHFREIGGEDDPQMAKTKRPHTLCRQDIWERLCDHWATEEAKKKGKSNSVNRKKREFESCHGSSSFTAHRYRMMNKETKEMPKPIEHFKDMHYSQSTGWINDVAQQRYKEMLQRRTSLSIQEDGSDSENITEGDIVNDVLGTRSSYCKSWGSIPRMKAGKRPRQKNSTSTSSGDVSHSTPVVEAVEALREQVMGQEQIIQGLIATLATAGFDVPIPSSHQHRLQPTLRFLHHIHRQLRLQQ